MSEPKIKNQGNDVIRKKCTKCGIVKPLEQYYINRSHRDGHYNECKECTKKRVRNWKREYKKNNLETYRKKDRENARKHKERRRITSAKLKAKKSEEFWEKYNRIHRWARNNKENTGICMICNEYNDSLQMANISGKYLKDKSDWIVLCVPCHYLFDQLNQTHKNSSRIKTNGGEINGR